MSNATAWRLRYYIHRFSACAILVALLAVVPGIHVFGQNRNAGEIRGTVTDPSGAVVPGATVTFTGTDTGVTTRVVANDAGVYEAPSLEPSAYTIRFTKEGFKELVRRGIVLHVEAITVDAVLQIGSTRQEVTVEAAMPLVQTETSERKGTFTEKTILELPNVGRNWFDVTGLLPGVNPGASGIGGGANGAGQDASGMGVGVNGTGSYQINFLTDGGVTTLPVSQNPGVTVPIDAIAEVNLSTSNFSAEYGNGVAVFNVITKSGTNQFHGSGYEFVQNDKLEARNFFALNQTNPVTGQEIPGTARTPLRWNEYGGTIGGPIRRNKAFFFFSYQSNPSNIVFPTYYTFPTAAMRAGDFSDPSQPPVYDPASRVIVNGILTRPPTQFPGNRILKFDSVAANIQNYFPLPNLPGLANNYYHADANPSTGQAYNGKLDYNLSASNRLAGSLMLNPGTSSSTAPACPIALGASSGCGNVTGMLSQAQITDAWTFSPTLVNEARVSFLRQYGVWSALDVGKGYPQKIGLKNLQADVFPNISIGGAVPTGLGGGLHAVLGFNSFVTSDTLTWIRGKHILKFGGEYNKWQQNQAWADIDAGDFDFSGLFTENPAAADPTSTGLGYADFLLGLPDNWGVSISPETGTRVWNLMPFAQDDYKIKPNLTLNIGVRYQLQPGWTEVHDRISNFDPTLINPGAGLPTGTLGALCFAGQSFGGHKCPRAQEKTITDLFAPRVGFAWSPKEKWSVRGAFGLFDLMWGANTYTGGQGIGWGTLGTLTNTDQLTPIFQLANGPPLPVFPSASARTPDMLNGQGPTYTPYNTPAAYVEQWHFDIQHQIAGGVLLDVAYVGSHTLHLGFGRDINQVPRQLLGPGDAQRRRPYPQYSGIYGSLFDGYSHYHSFQFATRKDFSRGLFFTATYTLSKTLDTGSGSGWGGQQSVETYQDAYNVRANYGPALFDITHLVNGSLVYELPVGSGKPFLNQSKLLNAFFGGWQVSSTVQLHTGEPFTPLISTNLSGDLACCGNWLPNRLGRGTLANPSVKRWFDPTAFALPAPFTFGNTGRNILRGPSWKNANLALAKNFRISKLGEGGRLQIRAEAYDVFNHPNFAQPNPYIDDLAGVGTITSTAGAASGFGSRNIQLGAKLSF